MIFLTANVSFAIVSDYSSLSTNITDPTSKVAQGMVNFTITNSQIEAFNLFTKASEKFTQSNVRAAYDDFSGIIESVQSNDFAYLSMAGRLADFGFFNLARVASAKAKDKDIAENHILNFAKFYFPKKNLSYEEEIYLAEIYSNIIFNEQSKEMITELSKNTIMLAKNDYANYLLSLAAYKSGNIELAKKHIGSAIGINPENLNYRVLEAEIMADSSTPEEALKIVDKLKKEKLTEYEFVRRIDALEQYVLYKISKTEWEKNYHLGYYYFYENEFVKASKTLQSVVSKKRKEKAATMALLSRVYLAMQEYEKAQDNAQKAEKILRKDSICPLVLGDLNYLKQDYKKALSNYKQAANNDKFSYKPLVKEAQVYMKIGDERRSKEIYDEVLKNYSLCYEAYYNVALIEPYKESVYLKKALAIKLTFIDAWLGLARFEIKRDNFNLAQEYLSTAYYLDSNDYRYYYYQGLIYKNQEDIKTSEYYFKKCLKLNPDCEEAKKELNL